MLTAGGVLGGALSFAFGDVGPLLWWLVIFTVTDFFLGTGIAVLQGQWSSHKNFLGILKKALMFAIVALAHGLDEVFAPVIHFQIFQSITPKWCFSDILGSAFRRALLMLQLYSISFLMSIIYCI